MSKRAFIRRTAKELRDYAYSLVDDIEFSWQGMQGLIMPFNHHKFILLFHPDDDGKEFNDVDEMMNYPYLDDRSLAEVCEEIEFYS